MRGICVTWWSNDRLVCHNNSRQQYRPSVIQRRQILSNQDPSLKTAPHSTPTVNIYMSLSYAAWYNNVIKVKPSWVYGKLCSNLTIKQAQSSKTPCMAIYNQYRMSILIYIDANQDFTPKNYASITMWPMTWFISSVWNRCIWELPIHLTVMSERRQLLQHCGTNCNKAWSPRYCSMANQIRTHNTNCANLCTSQLFKSNAVQYYWHWYLVLSYIWQIWLVAAVLYG